MCLFRTCLAAIRIGVGMLALAMPVEASEDRLGDPLPEGAAARLGTLRLRYGSIGDLAYLADDQVMIASGPVVEIWDPGTGERLTGKRVTAGSIQSMAVRRDGRAVLLSDHAGMVHEWDPVKSEMLRSLSTGQSGLLGADYSPDGTRVLTVGGTPPTLKQFDLASGRELVSIRGKMHRFSHAVHDATGRTAFVGGTSGSDPVLAHYDLATGGLLHQWHTDYISYGRSPQLSRDGERLLAGTRHMAVEFAIDGYKELNRFRGHHGYAVTAVAYCKQPEQILTGSRDGSIRRWDRLKNEILLRWVAHSGHCTHIRVSPDGGRVLSFGGGMVVESDLATGRPTMDWERHRQSAEAVAILPDGRHAVSGSADATLRLWDISRGDPLGVIEVGGLGVYAVAVAPDGGRVAAGCKDGRLREFRLPDGELLGERDAHLGYLRSVAYTPDGVRLLSSGDDGRIRLWQRGGEEPVQTMKEHRGGVLCVAVSADGRQLLSGGRDGTLRRWDLPSGRLQQTFEGHRGWVEAVCFAPDGKHALSSGRDGRILKWDLHRGEVAGEMIHGGWVRGLACSPDGKWLCAGGEDHLVTCWDLESGTRVARHRGHTATVLDLAITPDGRQLVSASADTSLLVWPLPAGDLHREREQP